MKNDEKTMSEAVGESAREGEGTCFLFNFVVQHIHRRGNKKVGVGILLMDLQTCVEGSLDSRGLPFELYFISIFIILRWQQKKSKRKRFAPHLSEPNAHHHNPPASTSRCARQRARQHFFFVFFVFF